MMNNGYTADITNLEVGGWVNYAGEIMVVSVCPFCGRAGLDLLSEIGIVSHVLSFQCDNPTSLAWRAPFWSSDLCHTDGQWTIAYPAIDMPTRIKHKGEPVWTQEQIDALRDAIINGTSPTGLQLEWK